MNDATPTPGNPTYRILMIAPTSFFADYGCHVRILEEVRALQQRGHVVRICTYHNGNDVDGVDTRRSLGLPWLRRTEVGSSRHKLYLDAMLSFTALRQAVAFRPDIIHGHLHEGALIASALGKLLRKPTVFDYQGSLTEEMLDHGFIRRGGLRERVVRWTERMIDRMPDEIIVSGVAAMQLLTSKAERKRPPTLIHDGVDMQRFDPCRVGEEGLQWRRTLGIPASATVVVYLGLLAEYQGTTHLLNVAEAIVKERDHVYFVIAGYPGVDRYAAAARARGIEQRVLFPGRIPYAQAPGLLALGDVAVAPKRSTSESNGKLLNYMAMALPVVASDTPTNRAILGSHCCLVNATDVDGWVTAILDAPATSPAERAALRQRVADEYAWSERVLDLEAIYAGLLESRNRRSVT